MNMRITGAALVAVLCSALAGCISTTTGDSWGAAHWPNGSRLKHATARAAKDPHTWAPLVGAALLSIGHADESVSDWAVRKTPLFGKHAADASDTLLTISKASFFVTGVLAPSASLRDKVTGLVVGAGTVALNDSITQGLKSAVGRERPNGQNDRSFPSGHASNSSTAATLAVANVDYLQLPGWAGTTLKVGLYSVAGGAAWARVEAEKHFVTDSLVGYALGHFIATFVQQAVFGQTAQQAAISFTPVGNGGALTLRLPLGAPPD